MKLNRVLLGAGIAVVAAIGVSSVAAAIVINSSTAPRAVWLCSGVASMMESSRPTIAAEQPAPADSSAGFAAMKVQGLADLDKGIAWAKQGCNEQADGGTLVPGIYRSLVEHGQNFTLHTP